MKAVAPRAFSHTIQSGPLSLLAFCAPRSNCSMPFLVSPGLVCEWPCEWTCPCPWSCECPCACACPWSFRGLDHERAMVMRACPCPCACPWSWEWPSAAPAGFASRLYLKEAGSSCAWPWWSLSSWAWPWPCKIPGRRQTATIHNNIWHRRLNMQVEAAILHRKCTCLLGGAAPEVNSDTWKIVFGFADADMDKDRRDCAW